MKESGLSLTLSWCVEMKPTAAGVKTLTSQPALAKTLRDFFGVSGSWSGFLVRMRQSGFYERVWPSWSPRAMIENRAVEVVCEIWSWVLVRTWSLFE